MGRTHAVSGAAAWLGVCSAATGLGHHPAPVTVLAGLGVCAGFALLPDADHPSALVSRTFGPLSQVVARGVAALSKSVYATTRTGRDDPPGSGHRTLTHTAVFAAVVGGVVALACWLGGRWGVGAAMTIAAGLALRGLLPARERRAAAMVRRGRRGVRLQLPWIAVAAVGAGLGCAWLPGEQWAWVGLAAGLGCLVHCLGDALTESGCPVLWPVPIVGRRWYPVGPPHLLRFRTGGWVEHLVVVPLFLAGGGLAGWGMLVGW